MTESSDAAPRIIQQDCSGRFGRIHVHRLDAMSDEARRPLLCLHPAPYGGDYFTTVMPLLADTRTVIAPDYPGYGGSTPPAAMPSIDDYALAMLDVLDSLDHSQADVMGFHTGCLVGVELTLRAPSRIGRLILIDVPYFVGEARSEMYAQAVVPGAPDRGRKRWGFHAAFTYAADERLPLVAAKTRVIATQSSLLEPTREAARMLPNCSLSERLDIARPVFENHARQLAAEIRSALE